MTAPGLTLLDAARSYTARGYHVVPIPVRSKAPVLTAWQELRLTEPELPQHFNCVGNIGLLLGEPSGWLVDVDLDCPEAIELAPRFLPPTLAVSGRLGAPHSHWWYICRGATTKKHHFPGTKRMIVEIRSTGAQTVVGPSIHPCGETYDWLTGEPASVTHEALRAAVDALVAAVVERTGAPPAAPPQLHTPTSIVSGDAVLRRAAAYLDAMPPAISGQGGHSTTFAAATAMVHGFGLDPDEALQLLLDRYNPRCEPPWSEKELRHKVNEAATRPHERPFGWLRDTNNTVEHNDVDLSGILSLRTAPCVESASAQSPAPPDPGLLPPELLRMPGFVGEIMDFCLETAPYPNLVLAFCGALALQAFLAGRKVRDGGDNRTNIYLLGLAHSSAGKDWPRKINTRIVHEVGLSGSLGERFASGEGIQDALFKQPSMLFQTDEIDGMLQSINKAKDARHEAIMSTLLTMYSSSNSVFPMRRKAGKESPGVIDQPNLIIFGTAIPNHYYEALSERMLTNGFFARMLILEAGQRGNGQEPSIRDLPQRVIETARWWAEFSPGKGNLEHWHPTPKVVEHTESAKRLLVETREEAESEYARAEEAQDAVGTTVWGRVSEQVRKLALLHAISANARAPVIDVDAVRWARHLVMHQTRRMLFMAAGHVAENPFHAECLKLMKKLRESPDRMMARNKLMRAMHCKLADFDQIIATLLMQGDVECVEIPTSTKPAQGYRLP